MPDASASEQSMHDVCPLRREAEAVTESELSQGLASLGYKLDPSETSALVRPMDKKGVVSKSAFVASQLDWPKVQADFRYGCPLVGLCCIRRQCILSHSQQSRHGRSIVSTLCQQRTLGSAGGLAL